MRQVWLGAAYVGGGRGVTQDSQEAVIWYRLAGKQEHVNAQLRLGLMYDQGQGVTQDYQEAFKWHYSAAEQGNVDAQFRLGVMYDEGQ